MNRTLPLLVGALLFVALHPVASPAPNEASGWTIYITNDNCPDYTWGYDEERTRQAFADIVRAHLDEMKRTDGEPPQNRDRYNMAVTQEALCFVERYPDRKDELIRRIKEGRVFVSPYLCNSLWAFQSFESAVRTFYPARRLEKQWGIPMDVAEHIEEPSLPWGAASILAGCGVRWLSVPFYNYDSTFRNLKNPPLFIFEGPDGSRVRVVMDPWASNKASYAQGAQLLRDTKTILSDWLPHYRPLGDSYPVRAILASGTHGDISPQSGGQARGFADAIINYNAGAGDHPTLVNATLPAFCRAVDEAQARTPFLPTLRGCFGHSWDVWPVSLAKYVADLREGERAFLTAESLLALASARRPELRAATRADRERAEWFWAMLADHAWNGSNARNKLVNAELRRKWSAELNDISGRLLQTGWGAMGLQPSEGDLVVFNGLSVPRKDLVRIEAADGMAAVSDGPSPLASQIVEEDGHRILCFVSPRVEGFGFRQFQLKPGARPASSNSRVKATFEDLESPYCRVQLDYETGGVGSLIHKPTGTELLVGPKTRTLCQTTCSTGPAYELIDAAVVANGPVLARVRTEGTIGKLEVIQFITVYAELDRVDFDIRLIKPVTTREERLCQVFPVFRKGATLRIETPGAVIRPRLQPEGDLLPDADTRRFAVQGFVDMTSPQGPGVTIAPLDAFLLRNDLEPLTFEALGNDQNYREVVQDQHGLAEFRFRYSLRAHAGEYNGAEAFAWSRSVASPLLAVAGALRDGSALAAAPSVVAVDPTRAIATCLKPADSATSPGCLLRLGETAGRSGPLTVAVPGSKRAFRTDLLERDLEELKINQGNVTFDLRAHGFGALRLER